MRSLVESGTQPAATGERLHHSPVMEPLRKPLVPFASARVETVLAAFAFPLEFYNSKCPIQALSWLEWEFTNLGGPCKPDVACMGLLQNLHSRRR